MDSQSNMVNGMFKMHFKLKIDKKKTVSLLISTRKKRLLAKD